MAFTAYSYAPGLAALGKGIDSIGEGFDQQRQEAFAKQAADLYLGKLGSLTAPPAVPAAAAGLAALGPLGASQLPSATEPAPQPPAMAGGTQAMRLPADPEVESNFISTLRAGGLTNPVGLGALAAYANAESGYSPGNVNRTWADPSQSGQPGTSGGLLSWRGPRLAAMQQATAGASDPVAAQAKFALTENPDLTVALQNAKTPEEANSLMANAWRFAGYDQPGGENARRLAMTRSYVARVGAGDPASAPAPTQVASGGPASPMPTSRQPSSQQAPQQQQADAAPAGAGPQVDDGVRFSLTAGAKANPNSPATSYTGPAVIAANRDLFINPETGQPRTVAEAASLLTPGGQPAAAPAPTGVAQADLPAPGARDAQFVVPGSSQAGGAPAKPPAFVPGTDALPASAPQYPTPQAGVPNAAPSQQSRLQSLPPAQVEQLKAMLANPVTRASAMATIDKLSQPEDFEVKEMGGQLYRVGKQTGTAQVIPGVAKPQEWTPWKGSDGSDYIVNKSSGQIKRAIEGKDNAYVDVTDPAERARIGSAAYNGPIQRTSDNQLVYPLKPATEINLDQKGESAFTTTSMTAIGKRFEDISKEGDTARNDLAMLGQLRDLGSVVGTGPLAAAKARLADYGVKVGDNIGAIEAYGSLVDKMVPSQRIPGSGSTSDFDAKGFKAALPRLMNTPEGNQLVIGTLEALAQDKIERARIAELAQTNDIKPADAIRQLRALPPPNLAFKSGLSDLAKAGKLSGAYVPPPAGATAPVSGVNPASAAAPAPAPQAPPRSAAPLNPTDAAQSLANARDAIKRGAPRAQVLDALKAAGVPADGL